MRARHNLIVISVILLCAAAVLTMLTSCRGSGGGSDTLTTMSELTTQRIGVQTGTLYETSLLEKYPDVEVRYFSTPTDMIVALQSGKLSGFLIEDVTYKLQSPYFPWLSMLEETVCQSQVSMAISGKTEHTELAAQLNAFISGMHLDGTADELEDYWLTNFDENTCVVDKSGITGENGTVNVAVETPYPPFSYSVGSNLRGYDIDFIYRFCREYGYKPVFFPVEYDAISVGLGSGKFDIGTNVVYSEERSGNVILSDPYKSIGIHIATGDPSDDEGSFFMSIVESFEHIFIKEDRWLLFVQGAATTLMITVFSAIYGLLVGFLLYLMCRRGNRVINRINDAISLVISSTPTVLMLMILYYIVFVGRADIGGKAVAIVGFSLIFGYSVYDIINTSVEAIGKGQLEGAMALGYNDTKAFFHVILPQTLRMAFPQLKSEIISLIKETSIVGYISIADLTRMSDIVRGRTYEAFFPLITTALIYFFLIWLLLFVVKHIEIKFTSRKRSIKRITRGINMK